MKVINNDLVVKIKIARVIRIVQIQDISNVGDFLNQNIKAVALIIRNQVANKKNFNQNDISRLG